MSVIQVGLVDRTGALDPAFLQNVAAAINIQVMRDLPQFWNVRATVRYLPDWRKIPVGTWPVFLVARLPPGEGGVHLDKKNQPYSLVVAAPKNDEWTIDVSHETIEMLIDPCGNRLQASRGIAIEGHGVHDVPGELEYLVEACDPCEGNQYAYAIHGVAVSDFITPHFYDPVATAGTRYSFGGNVKKPRQVLPGGYISFVNPQREELQQISFFGDRPQLRDLGPAQGPSLRAFVDGKTREAVRASRKPNDALATWTRSHLGLADAAALKRAAAYFPPER